MESNPDIDKDVEHIPVKIVSRRKIWLPVLVTAISIVAAAVITTAVLLASKGTDSNKFTEKPDTYATEPFETTEIRRTHHLHHIDFTTENATSSRITTSVTATNSTRISTSSSFTKLQATSLDPITSSKETPLATVSQTSLHKTYAKSNATTTYTPNYSNVNLSRATTSLYPKATRYQLISANSIASRSPAPLVGTKMLTVNTKTPVPITIARLLAPNNSNLNKPTFFTTKKPTKTSVHLIVGNTITKFKTPLTYFIKGTPKPTKTSVHIIAWTKTLKHQPNQHTRLHQPRVTLNHLQNPRNLKFLTFITTYVKSTTSLITPRIPLTALFTSVVTMNTAAPFSVTQSKKTIPSTVSRKIIGLRPQ